MRVDQRPPFAAPAAAAPLRRGAAVQGFSVAERGGPGKASAAAPTAPLASVDALLALQGEEDPAERRRRSLRRGTDLLDALDRLKAALLAGTVPVADLKQMAARLAERRDVSGDPGLDELLAHIELRAEVEIAKLSGRR